MKYYLIGLFLTVFLTDSAIAENWKVIADLGDGTRIVADANSFVMDKQDGKSVADVHLKIVPGDKFFLARIYVDECLSQDQGTLLWHYDGAPSHTKYFWTRKGDYMYDFVGQALCNTVKESKALNWNGKPPVWMEIAKSSDGPTLYGDTASADVYIDNEEKSKWARLAVKIGENGPSATVTVNLTLCQRDHKGKLMLKPDDGELQILDWSEGGTRISDFFGSAACLAGKTLEQTSHAQNGSKP